MIFFPEFLWRHLQKSAKDFSEVALVLKADHESDFPDAVLFGGKEPHGVIDADALDVFGQRVARAFLETAAEMCRLALQRLGNFGDFQRVLIAAMDIGHSGWVRV